MNPLRIKNLSNEPILENNTDHTFSENEIVNKLLDVEIEHLQRCYHTYLINHPINQSKPLAITNAAMSLMLPKGMKLFI